MTTSTHLVKPILHLSKRNLCGVKISTVHPNTESSSSSKHDELKRERKLLIEEGVDMETSRMVGFGINSESTSMRQVSDLRPERKTDDTKKVMSKKTCKGSAIMSMKQAEALKGGPLDFVMNYTAGQVATLIEREKIRRENIEKPLSSSFESRIFTLKHKHIKSFLKKKFHPEFGKIMISHFRYSYIIAWHEKQKGINRPILDIRADEFNNLVGCLLPIHGGFKQAFGLDPTTIDPRPAAAGLPESKVADMNNLILENCDTQAIEERGEDKEPLANDYGNVLDTSLPTAGRSRCKLQEKKTTMTEKKEKSVAIRKIDNQCVHILLGTMTRYFFRYFLLGLSREERGIVFEELIHKSTPNGRAATGRNSRYSSSSNEPKSVGTDDYELVDAVRMAATLDDSAIDMEEYSAWKGKMKRRTRIY
eukprot:CFRG1579T1